MKNKLCFVLGAGGARGIAHVGFLQAMEENGIIPDSIVGCSMGAVVGSCYAKGITPLEMKSIVGKLRAGHIIDFTINPVSKKALLASNKMQKVLKSLLGDVKFDELKIPFSCVATDIVSGEIVTLNKGLVEVCVRASSSIPIVFKPVEYEDKLLVDGGVVERVPVRVAKENKAEKIVAVDVLGCLKKFKQPKTIVSQALRVIDVCECNTAKNYFDNFKPDILIKPDLKDMSQFKVENLTFAYDVGYQTGLEYLDKIKKLIG